MSVNKSQHIERFSWKNYKIQVIWTIIQKNLRSKCSIFRVSKHYWMWMPQCEMNQSKRYQIRNITQQKRMNAKKGNCEHINEIHTFKCRWRDLMWLKPSSACKKSRPFVHYTIPASATTTTTENPVLMLLHERMKKPRLFTCDTHSVCLSI